MISHFNQQREITMTTQIKFETSQERHAFWQRHVDSHLSSGLSQTAYCKSHDLSVRLFWSWKKKLRPDSISTKPESEPKLQLFIPVAMPTSIDSPSQNVTCKLPNGIELSWPVQTDAYYVGQLVGAVL